MQLVPTCIPSVAKRHAKLNGARTLGLPILMEAHVLVGVGSTTMFDIIPEQDSITSAKLDHNRSSTVTLLLDDQLPTWLQGDEEGPCCSPANSDSIHYQFIYSLPELLRDIHQTRAPYVTMGRSNDLPRPEPRAKSPENAMSTLDNPL
jgi:hypothetical protein